MQNRSRKSVRPGRVPVQKIRIAGFAGSRRGRVGGEVSLAVLTALVRQGFHFAVGCASGIDLCIRDAVASSGLVKQGTVHCAFPSRVREAQSHGLKAVCRVADISSAAAALHWRTIFMVRECSLLVLFPDDPTTGRWGKGSRLAFNTAIQCHIPVFVVTTIPPLGTRQCRVKEGSLFGVIDGLWVVPQGVELRDDQPA